MPPQAAAHEALARLADADPASTCADLGVPEGTAGVRTALAHLREALDEAPRPDAVLQLFRSRLHADLPAKQADRHAALLTLLMAHGTARQHVRVPFDRATLARLD